MQIMVRTEKHLLTGLLLVVNVCSVSAVDGCQGCNISKDLCWKSLNSSQCDNVFEAKVNASEATIQEGDDVTLTCFHNIPNVNPIYLWFKDGNTFDENVNESSLSLSNVLSSKKGQYECCVRSPFGDCMSTPYSVSFDSNSVIIIVICGVSALALVIVMGCAMKLKLKKDSAKHKERMRQRVQAERNTGPLPRGY